MEPERRHCLPNQSNALSLSPTKELSLVNQHNRRSSSQRPHSANVEEFSLYETPKLNKTQSFCVNTNRDVAASSQSRTTNPSTADYTYQFLDSVISTPVVPRRRNLDEDLTQTTEKLRQDARLRARLKSNQDLGLSPEEKIALLRKRYNLENAMQTASAVPCSTYVATVSNKSDDMKVRERKMTTSKSVNDISVNITTATECSPMNISAAHRNKSEFTSNPNLGDAKASPKRRQKDPERRKSIIQAVSDFFHKKRDKDSPAAVKEKSEGMFGRLRISPKSKSKVHTFYECLFHKHKFLFWRQYRIEVNANQKIVPYIVSKRHMCVELVHTFTLYKSCKFSQKLIRTFGKLANIKIHHKKIDLFIFFPPLNSRAMNSGIWVLV